MIDPAFLDELARFDASLQRRVESRVQGEQASTRVGEGLVFSDHRRYVPGDDTRRIDWKVYARTEELYVEQYEAERNLTVHVLVDGSASMDFPDRTDSTHKFEYAAKLGLGFAALAAADHNEFRVSLLGETVRRLDRGRSTFGEVRRVLDRFNEVDPEGEGDIRRACEDYAATIDSKALVFLATDCLDDPEAVEAGLAALSTSDLTVAGVLAPEERDPSVRGETVFEDPERDRDLRTYFGRRVRHTYRDRLVDHRDQVEAAADRVGARFVDVDTGRPFFDAFADAWVD